MKFGVRDKREAALLGAAKLRSAFVKFSITSVFRDLFWAHATFSKALVSEADGLCAIAFSRGALAHSAGSRRERR